MDQADALYDLPDRRKESVALYADIAKRFPQAEAAPQAGYMAAFAALNATDFDAAHRHAEAFLKQHESHSLRPDVLFVNAESLIQLGRPDDAGKLYQELLEKYPDHADHELWQVRRALSLHLKKQHNEVVEYLWPLTRKFKQPALVAEAEFLLGSSLLERKNYKEAADAFNAALKAQPNWRQADETLLGLSLAQRGLSDLKAAKTTLQRLLAEFPKSSVLDRAHFRLGEFNYAAGEYKDAAEHHRWVIENSPNSQLAPHALFGLAWAQLSQQNADEAAKTFTRLLDEHKDNALAALRSSRPSQRSIANQGLRRRDHRRQCLLAVRSNKAPIAPMPAMSSALRRSDANNSTTRLTRSNRCSKTIPNTRAATRCCQKSPGLIAPRKTMALRQLTSLVLLKNTPKAHWPPRATTSWEKSGTRRAISRVR